MLPCISFVALTCDRDHVGHRDAHARSGPLTVLIEQMHRDPPVRWLSASLAH